MKKIILSIIVFLAAAAAFSAPERKISWDHVPGAWGYALEIKDSSDNIIVNVQQRANSYSVSKFEPGEYSFRIAALNMLKQKGTNTGWIKFTVEKLFTPQLKSVSKKQIVSGYENSGVYIYGKNLRPESRFFLRNKDREIEITNKAVNFENEAVFSIKPDKSTKGVYDLAVVNRGDVGDVIKDAFEIVEPTEIPRPIAIGFGYRGSYPIGGWGDYLAPSFKGGSVYLQFYFKSPALEHFFLEAQSDAAMYSNRSGTNLSSMMYCSFGLGGGYFYPVSFFDIFFKMNGGTVYTMLNLDKKIANSKLTSVDPFASASTGVRFYIGDMFFIEPALNWKTVFYKGEFLHEAAGVFSAGVKF